MTQTPGSSKDHQTFRVTERWKVKPRDQGKVGDDFRYVLHLPDGRCLYTRVSHPVTRSKTYDKRLWNQILKHQLEVTATQFWNCGHKGIVPDRGAPRAYTGAHLPVWLVVKLQERGAGEDQIHGLSVVEATQLLANLYRDQH